MKVTTKIALSWTALMSPLIIAASQVTASSPKISFLLSYYLKNHGFPTLAYITGWVRGQVSSSVARIVVPVLQAFYPILLSYGVYAYAAAVAAVIPWWVWAIIGAIL